MINSQNTYVLYGKITLILDNLFQYFSKTPFNVSFGFLIPKIQLQNQDSSRPTFAKYKQNYRSPRPTDWKLKEFVTFYTSGDIQDCKNYRTTIRAQTRHTSTILLIIILKRIKGKAEAELSDFQSGHRRNREIVDIIFILQIPINQKGSMQKRSNIFSILNLN